MNDIKTVNVKSRMIKSIGYSESESVLIVEFKKGFNIYHYYDVPKNIYDDLIKADSVGKYFLDHVKNKYECNKVSVEL